MDPLDGTTNFLHGTPHFAISIGLERDGQVVAGLVYNPVTDDLWTAEKGGGAFLNDRRIRVSARRKLSDCVVGTAIAHIGRGGHGRYLAQLRHMMPEVAGLRASGSAALDLAYVAAGRLDGFFIDDLDPWDMAAGLILVREAGGYVSSYDGGRNLFDAREVVGVISKGAAQSWQMENRYETMLDGHFEHGFAVDWMRKDLSICLDEARRNGSRLPVAALVDQFYAEVQAMGGGRWDTSALIARLRHAGD